MNSFSEIKGKSLQQLEGNWIKVVLVTLLCSLVTGVINYYFNTIGVIIAIPIEASLLAMYYRIAKDEGASLNKFILSWKEYVRYFIFSILIYLLLTVVFVIMLLISLAIVGLPASGILSISENFTSLLAGSLLLVIVMSIATIAAVLYISISYMMTPYIIFAKNDDIGAISAMKYARQLVKGYKWNIFVFELSFIGWWILAILLFVVGALTTLLNPIIAVILVVLAIAIFVFLTPYFATSLVNYYFELLKVKEDYAIEIGLVKMPYEKIEEVEEKVEENVEETVEKMEEEITEIVEDKTEEKETNHTDNEDISSDSDHEKE